jgi:pSer/pThr/pTyr-binding forkhead associated (FHA) protein
MNQRIRLMERGVDGGCISEIIVTAEDFLIGRGTDCNLRLLDDAVSRHHCSIRVTSDDAQLLDLGSSNGTYLNGRRIRSQASLQSGDEIMVGEHAYIVLFGEDQFEPSKASSRDPAASTRLLPKQPRDRDA